MKKAIFILAVILPVYLCHSQILKNVTNKVKGKAESNVNNKVDSTVDKAAQDVLNPTINQDGNTDGGTGNPSQATAQTQGSAPVGIKAYSKYDFVPGERIIWFEDFSPDAIGDLPDKWNTNGAGETVIVDGKNGKWFMLTQKGFYMPDAVDSLPENFTLEYDMLIDQPVHSWGIYSAFAELENRDKPEGWQSSNNTFSLNILPGNEGVGSCSYDRRKMGEGEAATSSQISYFKDISKPVHVAFWRQKERMRVYLNENKVWDVPKGIAPGAKLNSFIFWIQLTDGKWHFLISNLKLAVGAPDTRNKILTQNKWVTHGILFDVNSANIKPESFGTLKEMANVLKENADLKVKIVGHTDADGNDAGNLDLSKRRSASVKTMLAKEFAIDESRMETDGKGESEPIDKNDTPAGKANNRRVEFIKL